MQKFTTAGAESVPLAPWVNISGGVDVGDETGGDVQVRAWIGFLTREDVIVSEVVLVLALAAGVVVLVGS